MKLSFLSLASGSSGNCYYLGTPEYGILIDAGISVRQIKKVLKDKGIEFESIIAVIVTHDHNDHIKTVGCLGEKHNLPIYSTDKVHEGITKSPHVKKPLYQAKRVIEKGKPFTIRDLSIEAFEVPHDSCDNVGYLIGFGDKHFAIATDVGHVTDAVRDNLLKANYFVLETNYDEEMLQQGSYPDFLKERVAGPNGHLSNHAAAEFLATHYVPSWEAVWLCHLSRENNHPDLAQKTVEIRLAQDGIVAGKDMNVNVLKRMTPSDIFILG